MTIVIGLFTIPRIFRWIVGLGSKETTVVASVGLCFAGAYAADFAGYSVALGAFVAGSLIAESGKAPAVERLVLPIRDLFAAIFFVSVGMLIDPALVAEHWVAVVVFTLVVVIGKIIAVPLGAFISGSIAALVGAVPAVLLGGLGTIGIAALWMLLFPELRRIRDFDD